jgi:hypothetical protein
MYWAGGNLKKARSLRLLSAYFAVGLSANVLPAMVAIQANRDSIR